MAASTPFHILTKPIGPRCNLDCKYCFYLEKEVLWDTGKSRRMSDESLEVFVRKYIEAQPDDSDIITFSWQGGEPTLLGVSFFEKAVEFQRKYGTGKTIDNTIQTNGTLLDDKWCGFLQEHGFLVGLSIDGPKHLHDLYRVDRSGKGSFENVMRGVDLLNKYQVQWNSLTCVHRGNVHKPLDVYRFLRGIGCKHMQFIPIVERKPNRRAQDWGLSLACPEEFDQILEDDERSPVTAWSVKPKAYGEFLTSIFDRWVKKDVGRIYIQIIEEALAKHAGVSGGLCIFNETCGNALALEHDGSLYSCDHYVYPSHKLGNFFEDQINDLIESSFQLAFGNNKSDKLPRQCKDCPVKPLCNGGCPKQRFITDQNGNAGLNYLCEGYFHFFTHTSPFMRKMVDLFQAGYPVSDIMKI